MRSPTLERACGLLLALALLGPGACVSVPSDEGPREYLDETTAATVTAVEKPLVFAAERPESAAHARDYVTLAGVSVNRGGRVDYVLVAYFWSTVDERMILSPERYSNALVVVADDRQIRLVAKGDTPHDAGIGEAVHAPNGYAGAAQVYHTDLQTLRYIGSARQLAVIRENGHDGAHYAIWDDGRDALGALVRRASGER